MACSVLRQYDNYKLLYRIPLEFMYIYIAFELRPTTWPFRILTSTSTPPPIIVLGTAACEAQWWTVVRHGARHANAVWVAGEWIGWVRCNVGAY